MPTKKPTIKKKTPARKPVAAQRTSAARKASAQKAVAKKPVAKKTTPKVAARRAATRPAVRAVPTIVRRKAKAAQATAAPGRAERQAADPNRYVPSVIEPKWQAKWAADGLYTTNLEEDSKKKFYFVTMYPYPSGD